MEISSTPVRVSFVTNIPVPYRIPVYELLDSDGIALTVFYTAQREPNRHWILPPSTVRSETLRSIVLTVRGRYIHLTRGVWGALRRSRPDVIITTGFNPPQLAALTYSLCHGVPHVIQTDGTIESEAVLSPVHRWIRRFAARRSLAFVAASRSGLQLMQSWGAPRDRMHRSVLAVDNDRFRPDDGPTRDIDLLFSGQLSEVKNPQFALAVAAGVAQRLNRPIRIAFIGTGPLQNILEAEATRLPHQVEVVFAGFQQQDMLPGWYKRSRIFLFPTKWDPWGLVSNEAAAAGTPQIASPHAGAARDLLADGAAGYVEPLELDRWVRRVAELLENDELWRALSRSALDAVAPYTWQSAADGLRAAIEQAAGRTST